MLIYAPFLYFPLETTYLKTQKMKSLNHQKKIALERKMKNPQLH